MDNAAANEVDADLHARRVLTAMREAPSPAFEAITAMARDLLAMPVAAVNLLDADLQFTKTSAGVVLPELPRERTFCDHTLAENRVLVVPDTLADPRFRELPLTTGRQSVRFYAGVPLHATAPDTQIRASVGALCVMDREPRTLSPDAQRDLERLGLITEALIEAQLAKICAVEMAETAQEQARLLQRQERTFRQAERLAMVGSWRLNLATEEIVWSEGMYRIHDLPKDHELRLDKVLDHYPPHARATVSDALARTIETGAPFDLEVDFVTARGSRQRVRSMGEVEIAGGVPVAVTGVFQDVTEQWRTEQKLRQSASLDEVTHIANRAAFNRELENDLAQSMLTGAPLALILVDLDHFKQINDTHGHPAGDDVLRAVGRRLRDPMWSDSFAARLGGDEFALIVRDPRLCADLEETAVRLLATLARPVVTPEGVIPTSGTIGYATQALCASTNLREFIHCADSALYEAKRERRGSARGFDPRRERRRASGG